MDGPAGVMERAGCRAKKTAGRGHGWGAPQGCPAGGRAVRKKQPTGAMDGPAGVTAAGCRPKKQPAGAMDGPAGVKWRGQDSNL